MNKELLKKIGATVLAMVIPAGTTAFTACNFEREEDTPPIIDIITPPFDEPSTPPIDEPETPPVDLPEITEEDKIYNEDGKFNKEGFAKTFYVIMNSSMNDGTSETYDHYLNSSYDEYKPLYLYYDRDDKAVRLASFGTFSEPVEGVDTLPWAGEFRVVSFPIDMDDCESWLNFKDKFIDEITRNKINYELYAQYDHLLEESENLQLDQAILELSNEHYNSAYKSRGYENGVYSEQSITFLREPFEINSGRNMLAPVATLYVEEGSDEIVYVGAEVWVSTDGGWENNIINNTNLIVFTTVELLQVVGVINDTFCDLSESYQLEVENDDVAEADIDKNYSDAERVK